MRLSPLCKNPEYSLLAFKGIISGEECASSSLESILSFKPDLILGSPFNNPALVSSLRRQGLSYLSLKEASERPKIEENIRDIAARLCIPKVGEQLAHLFDKK